MQRRELASEDSAQERPSAKRVPGHLQADPREVTAEDHKDDGVADGRTAQTTDCPRRSSHDGPQRSGYGTRERLTARSHARATCVGGSVRHVRASVLGHPCERATPYPARHPRRLDDEQLAPLKFATVSPPGPRNERTPERSRWLRLSLRTSRARHGSRELAWLFRLSSHHAPVVVRIPINRSRGRPSLGRWRWRCLHHRERRCRADHFGGRSLVALKMTKGGSSCSRWSNEPLRSGP